MAKAKIRVHNQGKREYTIPPENKGSKNRKILPGRAIEIEKKLAEKMIEAYPRDLVEFDSLVSGEKKNLGKENKRLESENSSYLEKIEKLEAANLELSGKVEAFNPDDLKSQEENQTLSDENKVFGERIIDLELFIENSGLEVPVVEDKPGESSEADENKGG